MKKLIPLFAFTFIFASASAAVPLKWTVETSRAVPAQFEAYQGETLALEAALQSYGKPLEAPSNYALYWQTNGMGNAWWSQDVVVFSGSGTIEESNSTVPLKTTTTTNVLFATWSPTNDVGAKVYNCFIGQPGTIYHAAFQLRLRPSPGATPNELPLPQKVIDFAKVTVLNPPWSGGGGGGGVDTNAVVDIIHKTVEGSARTLPPYLHYLEMDDTYPDAAEEWYAQADYSHGSCSSVRDGNTLSRNYDWNFDFMPEFVVRTVAASATGAGTSGRFASLAVCNVGTNLTEADVVSGKWSRWYKALPGHAVDGINENGVACNINVVSGAPAWGGGVSPTLHPLAAVRWILDNATNAQHAATYIASHIRIPNGWTQNFHYMVADAASTYIVENGSAHDVTDGVKVLTNFRLYGDPKDTTGEGQERYIALTNGANITSQWWTLTYTADGYRASDLPGITGEALTQLFDYWENNPRESHRGESFGDNVWWQTVHTSVYDISNCVLRICVQETPDWYVFQVTSSGSKVDLGPIEAQIAALQDGKVDKVEGKGLSQNDYTDADKAEVAKVKDKADEFTEWVPDADAPSDLIGQPKIEAIGIWIWRTRSGAEYGAIGQSWDDDTFIHFENTYSHHDTFNATRKRVLRTGDAATPQELADAISSENPTVSSEVGAVVTNDVTVGFTDWVSDDPAFSFVSQPEYDEEARAWSAPVLFGGNTFLANTGYGRSPDSTVEDFGTTEGPFTARRFPIKGNAFGLSYLSDLSAAISTNNPAFVSAARAIVPATIRTYDNVRKCWWVLEMVNGVPTWTVED